MNKLILVTLFLLLAACNGIGIIQTDSTTKLETVADRPEGAHPYFNDLGMLYWYSDKTFEDALKKQKYIVVEYGRKT